MLFSVWTCHGVCLVCYSKVTFLLILFGLSFLLVVCVFSHLLVIISSPGRGLELSLIWFWCNSLVVFSFYSFPRYYLLLLVVR